MARFTRRQLLTSGAGLVTLGLGGRLLHQHLPETASGHNRYFENLSQALDQAGLARPSLVIDQQRAAGNLKHLLQRIQPDFGYRIVAKSLPSPALLQWLMARANTRKLMVFNEPFLREITARFPDADILMGKPLPVQAAEYFYQQRAHAGFAPDQQLQWLIDSRQRLDEYATLAESLGETLRVSLEINIGLERGGFDEPHELDAVIPLIQSHPHLMFSGFMGYEAHIAKAPGSTRRHFRRAMDRYRGFLQRARDLGVDNLDALTLNTGGSTTYPLYENQSVPANELAVGSAIVQPTDFDVPGLDDHQPAAFIAAPILKTRPGLDLPGAPGVGALLGWWNREYQQTFFIDGGYWKAEPESPPGLRFNSLYGRSSNQEMLNGPADLALQPNDWLFLRPTQSESVLLQFGDLLVYDGESRRITERWPVLAS